MSLTPEGKLKREVKKWLADLPKRRGWTVSYFMPVQRGYGKMGISDFICCIDGLFVAIETKAPGEGPTARQSAYLSEVVDASGVAAWLDNVNDLDTLESFIAEMLEEEA